MAKNDPRGLTVAASYHMERNRVLLSLDVVAARVLQRRYHLPTSDDDRETLAGIHRARLKWPHCPPDKRQESERWLEDNYARA